MARIWRYVLATDNGMAPCVQDGVLSLSCCKPKIRLWAQLGDWVIGFQPKRMGVGRVAWAGQVSEIVTLGDYQARFPKRDDAIYKRTGYSLEGRELLTPLREDYHSDIKSHVRDQSGKNVLLFMPFWYWGSSAIQAPEQISEIAHYYIGQSSKGSTVERRQALETWLGEVVPGVHGQPRERRLTKNIETFGA